MDKIAERIDLSSRVLEIDIYSPIFQEMLNNLNTEIERTIKKVYDKDFVGGEISLKLNIEIPKAFKDFPKKDEFGEMTVKTYAYRRPRFIHKVTTTLKKQFKQEGEYEAEREIKVDDDGRFIAVPVEDPQVSMFDENE
jgi:hypothetical protein